MTLLCTVSVPSPASSVTTSPAAVDHVGVVAGPPASCRRRAAISVSLPPQRAAVERVVAGVAGERVVEGVAGAVDVGRPGQGQVLDVGAERVA